MKQKKIAFLAHCTTNATRKILDYQGRPGIPAIWVANTALRYTTTRKSYLHYILHHLRASTCFKCSYTSDLMELHDTNAGIPAAEAYLCMVSSHRIHGAHWQLKLDSPSPEGARHYLRGLPE